MIPADVIVIGLSNFFDLSSNPIFFANFKNRLKKIIFKRITTMKKLYFNII